MHMADALLSPQVAGTMYVCSALAAAYAVKKVKEEKDPGMVPKMGILGAFVFAAQMMNFAIPGTGSSGHICGGLLLSAVVGPWAGFLTMICVLTLQCLLFADGGLLALGANIWNMAFYGCFIGGGLLWQAMAKSGITSRKIAAVSVLGSVLTLQMGAFSVSAETYLSGITELPFTAFLLLMQPIHLAIGLVEGGITAAVLGFLYSSRPELLWQGGQTEKNPAGGKKVLAGLGVFALFIGGVLSHFASGDPDGLEWSIAGITGSTELAERAGSIFAHAAALQEKLSLLPDYQLPGVNESLGGTAAGLIGTILVMVLACLVGRLLQKRNRHEQPAPRH